MSNDPAANIYRFSSTPHRPLPTCTAQLIQTIFVDRAMGTIDVHIPCDLEVHRLSTRHHYVGTTVNGATVEMYWRDESTISK